MAKPTTGGEAGKRGSHGQSGNAVGGGANDDYEVGYGKPPKETQFPHQKTSRRGRQRGERNWSTLIREELGMLHAIENRDGEVVELSTQHVLVKQLITKAGKGDLRALELIIKYEGISSNDNEVDISGITPAMIISFLARHPVHDWETGQEKEGEGTMRAMRMRKVAGHDAP